MTHQKTRKQQKNQISYACVCVYKYVFLAAFITVITISCGKITTASDELIGVWKSSNGQYKDTSFEIHQKAITFRTKEGDSNSYGIVEIKKEMMEDKEWVLYTIYYINNNLQKMEFPFYYQLCDSGVIRFKNQPSLVWRKDRSIKT
jgi:hypothetical protein